MGALGCQNPLHALGQNLAGGPGTWASGQLAARYEVRLYRTLIKTAAVMTNYLHASKRVKCVAIAKQLLTASNLLSKSTAATC